MNEEALEIPKISLNDRRGKPAKGVLKNKGAVEENTGSPTKTSSDKKKRKKSQYSAEGDAKTKRPRAPPHSLARLKSGAF